MKKNYFDLIIIAVIAVFLYYCVTTSPAYKELKANRNIKAQEIKWHEIGRNKQYWAEQELMK